MHDDLRIGQLHLLYELLLKHTPELDHVALDEVLHRQRRRQIARIDYTPVELSAYLNRLDEVEDALYGEGAEHDDQTDPFSREGQPPLGERSELAEAAGEDEAETTDDEVTLAAEEADEQPEPGVGEDEDEDDERHRLCRAVLVWLHDEVARAKARRPRRSFRLRLHAPKGGHLVSLCFSAEGGQTAAPPPPMVLPMARSAGPGQPPAHPAVQVSLPPPSSPRPTPAVAVTLGADHDRRILYLDPETIPEARVWRALGQATEELLTRIGVAYGNIINLQSRTVQHQATQLDKSQSLVESLAGQLLVAKRVRESDEAEVKVDERQLKVREELGKTFINELGSLGRAVASSRLGLPPELIELGDLVTASPELAEAIRDPEVRALLRDETTRKELARLLTAAATQQRAAANASRTP